MVEAYLVEHSQDGRKRHHRLRRPETSLGRGARCDIVLDGELVSRRHAVVEEAAGSWCLRDLESTNGCWVNGERALGRTALHAGDMIRIADRELQFSIESEVATVVGGPAPLDRAANMFLLDPKTRSALVGGRSVSLAPKEYALLEYVASRPGEACARSEIAKAVWPEFDGDMSAGGLDQLVARVRRKIEREPHAPQLLLTVRGYGYRLLQV